MRFQYFAVLVLLLNSCSKPSLNTTETLTIFTTKMVNTQAAKDSLLYKEMITYDGDQKKSITYYDADAVKGIESFYYDKKGFVSGANYTSPQDSTMSYYKFVTDNLGRKISSTAFDAANDEVLRIETFEYDPKGNITSRSILSSDHTIQRKYVFKNDATGNPLELVIYNQMGDTIVNEIFKYTKYDEQKRWTEKWGFVNDAPKTCYVRTFSK